MNPIRVGAQLFVNRHDTEEIVEGHVRRMAEADFTVLRVFLVWDHLEPREGEWRWAVYDRVFSAAAEHGLKVVGTLMAVSPPGWMRRTDGLQDVADLDDPALWQRSLDYVAKVVARWQSSPALDSWILWNEPARILARRPRTLECFRGFLEGKYRDIAALNRLYFRQYESFAEVGAESSGESYALGFGSRVEQVDWLEFTSAHLMAKLRDLAAAVRAAGSSHPLHVNPHRISQCLLDSGQSIWSEAQIVDFMGFSAHPPWHSTRFPEDRVQQSVGMFADLVRSATRHPEGRFWCTELQGGPTVVTAFRPSYPDGAEIARWMWESAASGAEAIIFWCFNTREEGYEAGEWSLCQLDGSPSPRLTEASRLARFFREHAGWFAGARPQPDVAIFHSEASQLLGFVEGEGDDVCHPRNRQMAADASCGAYLMLSDLGLEAGFVNEQRIREGKIPSRVLIAPGCTVVDPGTREALGEWVKAGGILISDAAFGWKDANGNLARSEWPRHADLFGAAACDFAPGGEVPFFEDSLAGEGWFFRLKMEAAASAKVRGRWTDGTPAVIENSHGSGLAIRVGTVFFQRYLAEPHEGNLRLLEEWLSPFVHPPVRQARPVAGLRLRTLRTPGGAVCVIFGPSHFHAHVSFTGPGRWQEPGGPWAVIPEDRTVTTVLDERGVACIRADFGEPFPQSSENPCNRT